MIRGDCGCKNHLGKRKVKYPSHDLALTTLIDRHLKHGPHHVYPCPNMGGVWHIASN